MSEILGEALEFELGSGSVVAAPDSTIERPRVYSTLSDALSDPTLVPGEVFETLGFSAKGDFGGGTYEIVSGATANNCTIFALANGYFAKRVFTEKWVYLESLNVQNVSFDTINALLLTAGVKNVRCGILTLDKTVIIGGYDFEFDELTYTGTGNAIEVWGVSYKYIRGNNVKAPNGSGIYISEYPYNVLRNKFEIRDIVVKDTGIRVHPCHGKGVMHNRYEIGNITAERRGFETYIPANGVGYSWQGEEHIAIGSVYCLSGDPDNPGVGVSFVVEPHPDPEATGSLAYSKAGTITGITFDYLGVENTDIGVQISAAPSGTTPGGTSPVPNQEPGIKSIVIHNMRCREYARTDLFLKAFGYLKDIYIKPTSAVQLCQWQITNTARDVGSFIDAPVYEHSPYVTIGNGIKSIRGIAYVAGEEYHPMTITGNTDFSVMGRRALYARTALASPTAGKLYFFFPDTSDSEWHRTLDTENDVYVSYTYDGGTTWTTAASLDGQVPATSGLFIAKHFELDASRAGQTTNVNMAYYYKESASDLMFKLPAATSANTVLNLKFDNVMGSGTLPPDPYEVELTNSDTQAAHLYSVSVLTNFSTMKDTAIVRDLGAVT